MMELKLISDVGKLLTDGNRFEKLPTKLARRVRPSLCIFVHGIDLVLTLFPPQRKQCLK